MSDLELESKADIAAKVCGSMNCESNWPWIGGHANGIDVAHANGKVQLETYRLWNRVIWARHEQYRPEMERLVWEYVMNACAHEKPYWIPERPGFFLDMVKLAIKEVAEPFICKTCNGNKQIVITRKAAEKLKEPTLAGKVLICQVCEGTGYRARGNRYLACELAVSEAGFRQTWRDRYNHVLGVVRYLDGAAKSALSHRLGY